VFRRKYELFHPFSDDILIFLTGQNWFIVTGAVKNNASVETGTMKKDDFTVQ
jgi:hypothetical protein